MHILSINVDVLFQLIDWADKYVEHSGTSQISSAGTEEAEGGLKSRQGYDYRDMDEFGRLKAKSNQGTAHIFSLSSNLEQRGKHETFFCCVQAACYIVCFHGIDMAGSQCAGKDGCLLNYFSLWF